MLIVDYILLAIMAYSIIWGFRKGLIQAVGGLLGMIGAIVLASRLFEPVAQKIAPIIGFGNSMNLARMVSFVAILLGVNYGISLIVALAERAYEAFAILPFMKFGNRLLAKRVASLIDKLIKKQ